MNLRYMRGFLSCPVFMFVVSTSARAQHSNTALETQVGQLAKDGNFSGIEKLIEAEESLWKTSPSVAYFRDMRSIAAVLLGGTNDRVYWLGRKAAWDMLLKPPPNEYLAARLVRDWKEELFVDDIENTSTYEINASPDMFAAIRHDTFLMVWAYARQLHATIIPKYRPKAAWSGNPDKQNLIDNEVQEQAGGALGNLAQMQEEYLVDAYGHEPRNNEELLMILDILDIPEATREKIAERCMGGMYWPNVAYCHEPRDDEELKKRLDILDIYGGAREMIIQWARYERLYWAAMKPSSMSDGNAAK